MALVRGRGLPPSLELLQWLFAKTREHCCCYRSICGQQSILPKSKLMQRSQDIINDQALVHGMDVGLAAWKGQGAFLKT